MSAGVSGRSGSSRSNSFAIHNLVSISLIVSLTILWPLVMKPERWHVIAFRTHFVHINYHRPPVWSVLRAWASMPHYRKVRRMVRVLVNVPVTSLQVTLEIRWPQTDSPACQWNSWALHLHFQHSSRDACNDSSAQWHKLAWSWSCRLEWPIARLWYQG